MVQPDVSRRPSPIADWSWATVLVVDDEDVNRTLLAGIARGVGIGTIVEAHNGIECLDKLETVRPDLIILDIVMPELDGFATCARIRALPEWAEIPILVQTALTSPQDVLACFEAGASDVVNKPLRPAELSARLRVHLDNRRLVRTLRDANQRIHREMRGAREMQRTLLPSNSILDRLCDQFGLIVEGRVEPLDGVGGDIWGARVLDDNLVAILVADFSGHGLMAALNTFWLHAFMAKQFNAMQQPAEFLKLLNNALRANLMRGHFATFFFGLIDLERDELRWSGAGSPKPILIQDQECHLLDTTGLPLGLTDRAVYTNHAIAFPPGARLLLYSDGLTDVETGDGSRIEAHGLLNRLHPHFRQHPDTNLAAIWETVIPANQTTLCDDTTAVWIRRQPRNRAGGRTDPRHINLNGVDETALAPWLSALALPHRRHPLPESHGRGIHLIGHGLEQPLTEAFAHPFSALIEIVAEQLHQAPPEELATPPGEQHLLVSLTTTTAYHLPLPMLFCDALVRQGMIGESAKGNILLALQEAVANGVVHGNLELHSPRRAFENMRAYWAEIRRRLADPAKAQRRITVAAHQRDGLVVVTVTDQGKGYNPDAVQSRDPSQPHGKGLKLISQLALARDIAMGGRQHILTFANEME